ncbi:MAG: hypothetical protein AAF393_05215 [Pseudomonadota bacterium]
MALLTLARAQDGAVVLLAFEGDAVHLMQIATRMHIGEVPGIDFVTPLGALAFLPFVWLMKMGQPLGASIAYAPVFLALLSLPLIWWAGVVRLSRWAALVFGGAVLVSWMSLLHGGTSATVTLSMYYNNWGWALVAIVSAFAFTPARGDRWLGAIVIGAGLGALAVLKAPFAAFLAPAVVLAFGVNRRWSELGMAFVAGLVVVGLVALPLGGVSYLQAYIADLLAVATSEVRASPGRGIVAMILQPLHFVLFVSWIAVVVFLRQAGRTNRVLVYLALGAGFFAMTHQNWQNDPHWALIFGLLIAIEAGSVDLLNRYGWHLGRALQVMSALFLVLAAPGVYVQAQSLLVHAGLNRENAIPLVAGDPTLLIRPDTPALVKRPHPGQEAPEPIRFAGEDLPWCEKDNGLIADLQASGKALNGLVPTKGKTAFYADWVNAIWLWSDLDPLPGGAPWYYGGAPGLEKADYLVVPICPMGRGVRNMALRAVEAAGGNYQELGRDARMIVYGRVNP